MEFSDNQTSAPKSSPNCRQHILNLNINLSNNGNLSKYGAGIFTRQGHINQVY